MHITDRINRQLRRIGARDGECPIEAIDWRAGRRVYITDHAGSSGVYDARSVLTVLRTLPEDAGWQSAWDAINRTGMLPEDDEGDDHPIPARPRPGRG
jgi:hypothetical protein